MFITVLAKHLERPRDGARLSPKGGSPKNTYTQIEEWWNELQAGKWLPPTPPGTLIELNWDFFMDGRAIPLQMFDYAGETLTDLFNSRSQNAEGAAKQYFDEVRNVFESASVLLVLLNLESLIEQGVGRATETKATLITAMTAFLSKIKADNRDCRVCFVFTSYDRYESLIKQRWGSVQAFLEREIPPLYYELADKNKNVKILPVAAVGDTETRVDPASGVATIYPKPGFRTRGFDQLVRWIVQATSDSKAALDEEAEKLQQDAENIEFVQGVMQAWEEVRGSTQVEPLDRFLGLARGSFPHPHRPIPADINAQLQSVVESASDLHSSLVRTAKEHLSKRVFSAVKSVAMVVALSVGGCFLVQTVRGVKDAAKAELLKAPQPVLINGEEWSWAFNCNQGIWDCWEHRATAKVPIWNKGGAGNITAKVSVGAKSNSVTRFFNSDEKAWVTVTVGDLPSHENGKAYLDLKPTQ